MSPKIEDLEDTAEDTRNHLPNAVNDCGSKGIKPVKKCTHSISPKVSFIGKKAYFFA